MKLDRVTITGADDSVRPEGLAKLSAEFPFAEWGILLSASRAGTPRFPSYRWLTALYEHCAVRVHNPRIACHICGVWARDLAAGRVSWPWLPDWLPSVFGRAQINVTLASEHDVVPFAIALDELYGGGQGIQEFVL